MSTFIFSAKLLRQDDSYIGSGGGLHPDRASHRIYGGEMIAYTTPQYTRNEVDFATWYSAYAKQLAAQFTAAELTAKLYGANAEGKRASASHLRAIDKTSSMTSNSAARAHGRNVAAASGDYALALCAALEIHELFPERAKIGA